jgi:hypothetical protein
MYNKLWNKQDGFFSSSHVCIKDKDHQISLKGQKVIWSHEVMFVLWQHFHLLCFFVMSITIIMVPISFKDILDSYNRKPLILIL